MVDPPLTSPIPSGPPPPRQRRRWNLHEVLLLALWSTGAIALLVLAARLLSTDVPLSP